MKKFFALLALSSSLVFNAQTATVNYSPTTETFSNPERGFYKHTETHSASYYPLSQSVLNGYRQNENITLILRVFYLEDFVTSPISSTYLSNMQADFAKVRAAGLKCIVRFAYSDDNDSDQPQDATKSQVLAHILQLKPILMANSDVIPVMQAGFIGAWGEWYYTDNFGMNPTATDFQNRKDVVNAILSALPEGKMVQIRTPSLKQNTYGTATALAQSQAFSNVNVARVGHHNDCFLASSSDYGTYTNAAAEYPYLEQETKFTPMGGETCAINAPRSQCQTAVLEMQKFHYSYLNLDYHPGVIDGFEELGCFDEIENRLGYRFEFVNGIFPQTANIGGTMPFTLKIKNSGFASPYNQRTAYMVWKNVATNVDYKTPLLTDSRFWAGGTTQTIVENPAVPAGIPAGTYRLYLSLPDRDAALASRPEYSIRFANSLLWDNVKGYNDLQHTITVNATLGINDNNATASQFTVYPVPANDQLTMEFEGIEDFKVLVHNTLGQMIKLPVSVQSSNKLTLNTSSLSNGIYFVTIEKGNQKETKRIIVGH